MEVLARIAAAATRTEDKLAWSISIISMRDGSKIPSRADWALATSRAVRKSVAPVAARARVVSMPIPEDVPVMTMTSPLSLPSASSSLIICRAVGRASPGPLGVAWAST